MGFLRVHKCFLRESGGEKKKPVSKDTDEKCQLNEVQN